jgi:hypothetical protein
LYHIHSSSPFLHLLPSLHKVKEQLELNI